MPLSLKRDDPFRQEFGNLGICFEKFANRFAATLFEVLLSTTIANYDSDFVQTIWYAEESRANNCLEIFLNCFKFKNFQV